MAYENTDNNRQDFRPMYYSPVKFKNELSPVDPSELSFAFWKGLLKITISPKVENSNLDYITFDHKNNIEIFINHTKARMLYNEMAELRANPDSYNSVGINTGSSGLISVSNGKEVGINGLILIIRKLNLDGTVQSSYMYQFNRDYHFAIRNFDENTLTYDKHFYNDIEYDEFMQVLKNYYENIGGYIAASTIDANRFENRRVNTKIGLMMDKLGIPKFDKNNGSSKSFFDMANEGSAFAAQAAAGVPNRDITSTNIDDIMEGI